MENHFIFGEVHRGKKSLDKYTGTEPVVEVPDGVYAINTAAFSGCASVERIILPQSCKFIFNRAFENCVALREVYTGNNLLAIGREAFRGCKAFERLTLPNANMSKEYNSTNLGALLFSGVGRSFQIIFSGSSVDFDAMTTYEAVETFSNGDYHHPTSSHFDYSETRRTTTYYVFGNEADTDFECEVHCLADGKILKYKSIEGGCSSVIDTVRY